MAGDIEAYIKSTFSEYYHVAFKLKGMKHTIICKQIFHPYTYTIDPLGGVKRSFFSFLKVVMCISN